MTLVKCWPAIRLRRLAQCAQLGSKPAGPSWRCCAVAWPPAAPVSLLSTLAAADVAAAAAAAAACVLLVVVIVVVVVVVVVALGLALACCYCYCYCSCSSCA